MAKLVRKGGKGSGNWGHAGRPGKVGGSAKDGAFLQSTLFDIGKVHGKWADPSINLRKKLQKIGYSFADAEKLAHSGIPYSVLESFYDPLENVTARYYISFYNAHKDDEAFDDFMNAGFSFADLDKIAELANEYNIDNSLPENGFSRDLFRDFKVLAFDLEIPIEDTVPFNSWLQDYGDMDVYSEAFQLAPYLAAGITDPDIADELAYNSIDPEIVREKIKDGYSKDDLEEMSTPLDPLRNMTFDIKELGASPVLKNDKSEFENIDDWWGVDRDEQGQIKNAVEMSDYMVTVAADKISRETNVSDADVRGIINHWGRTSNGDAAAVTVQTAIKHTFQDALGTTESRHQGYDMGWGVDGDSKSYKNAKQVVAQMYANTQAEFESMGITHVDLYRGVRIPEEESYTPGEIIDFGEGIAESWTIDPSVSSMFADATDWNSGLGGLVIKARVPVKRILSTPMTGFGVLSESEFVVLGSPLADDNVAVHSVSRWEGDAQNHKQIIEKDTTNGKTNS